MRRTILITIIALAAGLFIAGPGLGAMHEMGAKDESGMKTTQGSGMAHKLDNKQVRELQKILNEKGFESGPVDGVIGPKTTGAIREFQESRGLVATGSPDQDTLRQLAPDAETQELFGLSPEFGEESREGQMQPESQEHDQMGPSSESESKGW